MAVLTTWFSIDRLNHPRDPSQNAGDSSTTTLTNECRRQRMTPQQIKTENDKACKLGIARNRPDSREELLDLVAGLLAHHSPVEITHRSKALALVDGLNLHGLLTDYTS